eukprot:1155735-Pelagomonas_calceolata.AAC.7
MGPEWGSQMKIRVENRLWGEERGFGEKEVEVTMVRKAEKGQRGTMCQSDDCKADLPHGVADKFQADSVFFCKSTFQCIRRAQRMRVYKQGDLLVAADTEKKASWQQHMDKCAECTVHPIDFILCLWHMKALGSPITNESAEPFLDFTKAPNIPEMHCWWAAQGRFCRVSFENYAKQSCAERLQASWQAGSV